MRHKEFWATSVRSACRKSNDFDALLAISEVRGVVSWKYIG